jgi:CRP-like cAMP-binding protein
LIGLRRKQIEAKISDLVFRNVPSRLAAILLDLLSQHGVESERGKQIKLRVTHKDLSRLAATTRETVSACLSQWKKQGILDSHYGKISVYDIPQLTALSKTIHASEAEQEHGRRGK